MNFGVLPLTFVDPADYDRLELGDTVEIRDVAGTLATGYEVVATIRGGKERIRLRHELSPRQIELLLGGGVINLLRERLQGELPRTVA